MSQEIYKNGATFKGSDYDLYFKSFIDEEVALNIKLNKCCGLRSFIDESKECNLTLVSKNKRESQCIDFKKIKKFDINESYNMSFFTRLGEKEVEIKLGNDPNMNYEILKKYLIFKQKQNKEKIGDNYDILEDILNIYKYLYKIDNNKSYVEDKSLYETVQSPKRGTFINYLIQFFYLSFDEINDIVNFLRKIKYNLDLIQNINKNIEIAELAIGKLGETKLGESELGERELGESKLGEGELGVHELSIDELFSVEALEQLRKNIEEYLKENNTNANDFMRSFKKFFIEYFQLNNNIQLNKNIQSKINIVESIYKFKNSILELNKTLNENKYFIELDKFIASTFKTELIGTELKSLKPMIGGGIAEDTLKRAKNATEQVVSRAKNAATIAKNVTGQVVSRAKTTFMQKEENKETRETNENENELSDNTDEISGASTADLENIPEIKLNLFRLFEILKFKKFDYGILFSGDSNIQEIKHRESFLKNKLQKEIQPKMDEIVNFKNENLEQEHPEMLFSNHMNNILKKGFEYILLNDLLKKNKYEIFKETIILLEELGFEQETDGFPNYYKKMIIEFKKNLLIYLFSKIILDKIKSSPKLQEFKEIIERIIDNKLLDKSFYKKLKKFIDKLCINHRNIKNLEEDNTEVDGFTSITQQFPIDYIDDDDDNNIDIYNYEIENEKILMKNHRLDFIQLIFAYIRNIKNYEEKIKYYYDIIFKSLEELIKIFYINYNIPINKTEQEFLLENIINVLINDFNKIPSQETEKRLKI